MMLLAAMALLGAACAWAQEAWLAGDADGIVTRGEYIDCAARMLGMAGESETQSAEALRDGLNCWAIWRFDALDAAMTREECAAVTMLALLPDAGQGDWNATVARIGDFDAITGEYQYLVERAYANGVMGGMDDGCFHPGENLTRGQANAVLDACAALLGGQAIAQEGAKADAQGTANVQSARRGGVSENGWLQVIGTQLCNEAGEPVVLRGMSSHGMQWFGEFANREAIAYTADCGANVFRVAMYIGEGGYLSDKEKIKARVFDAVDAAIAEDIYVILDWHILGGDTADPMHDADEAAAFFAEAAQRYRDTPNVIFELCNEPNGNITWAKNVKPYAERIGGVIREIAPRHVMIVGTTTWSQDVDIAAADMLDFDNVMYACHFYAGTHGQWLRDKIDRANAMGAAVFVSEWGASDASGNGGPFPEQTREWLGYMEEKNLSWCNWSLCDKAETSAALEPGAAKNGGWGEDELTVSGEIVFGAFR